MVKSNKSVTKVITTKRSWKKRVPNVHVIMKYQNRNVDHIANGRIQGSNARL